MTDDPIQLIRLIVSRRRRAFEKLYDQYSGLVYSLALRVLKQQEDAEEVLQDVFVKVWHSAKDYDPKRANPKTWLAMLTRSRAIDRLRSIQRKGHLTSSLDDDPEVHASLTAKRDATQADAHIATQGLLKHLPENLREIMDLVYFKGLTQSEIAAELNLPLGTVKTRVRSALKALREVPKIKQELNAS